ncbi:MAG: hypothetical protein NVS9B10_04900 [Nevskia sp.]
MSYASTFMGRFRLFTLAACLPLWAGAVAPEPVDEATLKLDGSIQALKAEVLDINQRGLDVEENFLYPELTRVTVYVGVKAPGLLLNEVKVTIDDGAPMAHAYDTLEAVVLQRRGLYRLLKINAQPGAHRIKAEFSAHFADAKPEAPLLRGRYEAVFEKTLKPAELEFAIVQENFLSVPTMKLRDWRAAP